MNTGTDSEDHKDGEPEAPRAHLEDIEDGCGCAEIRETTSERRPDSDRE